MRKATIPFERVPVKHVRRLLEEQNNTAQGSPAVTAADKDSKSVSRDQRPSAKNLRKDRDGMKAQEE